MLRLGITDKHLLEGHRGLEGCVGDLHYIRYAGLAEPAHCMVAEDLC